MGTFVWVAGLVLALLAEHPVERLLRALRSDNWAERTAAQAQLAKLAHKYGDAIYEAYRREKDPDTRVRLLRALLAADYVCPKARRRFKNLTANLKSEDPEKVTDAARHLAAMWKENRPLATIRGFLRRFFKEQKSIKVACTIKEVKVAGPETLRVELLLTNRSPHPGWAPLVELVTTGTFLKKIKRPSFLRPCAIKSEKTHRPLPPLMRTLFPFLWLAPNQSVCLILQGPPSEGHLSFCLREAVPLGLLVKLLSPNNFPLPKPTLEDEKQEVFVPPPPEGRLPSSVKMEVVAPKTAKPNSRISITFIARSKYSLWLEALAESPLRLILLTRNGARQFQTLENPVVKKGAFVTVWSLRLKVPQTHARYQFQGLFYPDSGGQAYWTPRVTLEVK